MHYVLLIIKTIYITKRFHTKKILTMEFIFPFSFSPRIKQHNWHIHPLFMLTRHRSIIFWNWCTRWKCSVKNLMWNVKFCDFFGSWLAVHILNPMLSSTCHINNKVVHYDVISYLTCFGTHQYVRLISSPPGQGLSSVSNTSPNK